MRWADFPECDFTVDEKGIHAKNEAATKKRLEKFLSDDVAYCGCMEREEG
jgi:hypothetical protein